MNEKDFCYWLHGFFELQEAGGKGSDLTLAQVDLIKQHLDLVFTQVVKTKDEPAGIKEFLEAKKIAESKIKDKFFDSETSRIICQSQTGLRTYC